jgi:GTP-binding protein
MVDSVLLLVDALDGPMPQTRFVTQKAFQMGFKPIVVVNKIDRPGARPDWVVNQTFDLFDKLGATEEQLDFTTVYASALNGYAGLSPDVREGDMTPLFETIVKHVHAPRVDPEGPFQMRVSSLDYNPYVGIIGVGRIQRGSIKSNSPIAVVDRNGQKRQGKILQVLGLHGPRAARSADRAQAGDIIGISGIEGLGISETLCALDAPEGLPVLTVDEPTISMTFQVNNSPFSGKKDLSGGRFLTSRQIRDRLLRETQHNVSLRVDETEEAGEVQGLGTRRAAPVDPDRDHAARGLRARGVAPRVIVKEVDGQLQEPYEQLVVDLEERTRAA